MTKVSSSVLEGFAPDFKVFSLPYIFRDEKHKFDFFESNLGKSLLKSTQKFWLRGLCYYDAGSRSFYTKDKPILTPDDLRGLKIRIQESPTSVKLVNALGGSATPIAWGELYTALQQGVVDRAENNPPSFYTSKHYEVCKYYSLDEQTSVPDVLLISTVIWNELSEQEKLWFEEAADESYEYEKKLWREATMEALEEVQKAGADIVKVFPADVVGMKFFKSVLAPMPHLKLMPTGGVSLTNAGDWLKAGACAVGIGSALLDDKAIREENYFILTENARTIINSINSVSKNQGRINEI